MIYNEHGNLLAADIKQAVTLTDDDILLILPCEPIDVGWLLIHQRVDATLSFDETYINFKNGFGTTESNYFIGLSNLNIMTSSTGKRLQVYLESFDGDIIVFIYEFFRVLDHSKYYKFQLSGFSGPSGTEDCLTLHVNKPFKANKDTNPTVPASRLGWWNKQTGADICANLNGIYRTNGVRDTAALNRNIYWNSFKSNYEPLKRVKMSIM